MAYIPTIDDLSEQNELNSNSFVPSLADLNEKPGDGSPYSALMNANQNNQPTNPIDRLLNLPKDLPDFKQGTPQNKQMVENIINSYAGSPAMNVIGNEALTLGKGIKSALTKIDTNGLMKGVQNAHDKLLKGASDIYDYIKSEVKPRGVSNIDISPNLINEAEANLPKTRANKKLIEDARSGDYEALHNIQSDLGKKGTKALSSDLSADRNIGEEMMDTREKINEAIENKFKENGHEDLAKLLQEARGKYRTLKDTYYSHPTIAKLVNPEIRKIPSNPLKTFSEESVPMQKVLNSHPELSTAVKTNDMAKEFFKKLNKLKNVGIGTGIAGGAIYGAKQLSNSLDDLGDE